MEEGDDVQKGDIRYLSVEDLQEVNRSLIHTYTPSEQVGVFNDDALQNAQQRPLHFRYYKQTNDLLLLAAALFVGIARGHPFYNANKRTAYAACRIFLLLNGAAFDPPMNEVIDAALDVVEHRLSEEQVAYWISQHSSPIDCGDYLSAVAGSIGALADWR